MKASATTRIVAVCTLLPLLSLTYALSSPAPETYAEEQDLSWLTNYYGKTLSTLGEITAIHIDRTPRPSGRSWSHRDLWRMIEDSTLQDWYSRSVALGLPPAFTIDYSSGLRVEATRLSAHLILKDGRKSLVLAQPASQSALKAQSALIQERFRTQRYEAIRILEAERSESARALLLEIALGQHGSFGRESAATSYLNSLDDKREAVRLLNADDSIILNRALLALRGLPVEGELWDGLKPVLLHGSWWARRDCAAVLYVDSSGELGEDKARAILESLGSAWMLPDGDSPPNS